MRMNANRADHGIGRDAEQRNRHDRNGDIIDRITIVAIEQSLLLAKNLPP
jgi:hypothetical protein